MLPALAALELLHTFALVHDDVMDALRHPARPAHRAPRRSPASTAARPRGDPDRFGGAAAILVGDLCLVWADQLLARAPDCRRRRCSRPARCYDRMRIEAIAGQYLDVLGEAEPATWSVGPRRCGWPGYKTASYTVVQRPLHFGAALAGAARRRPPVDGAYTRYGLAVGEAFQLRDDLLGVYGDPAVTGKPAGDDLRTGKPTALLMLARRLATPAQRSRAGRRRTRRRSADGLADRLIARDRRGRPAVEAMIAERVDEALAALRRGADRPGPRGPR